MKSAEGLFAIFQERTCELGLIIRKVRQDDYIGKDLHALRVHIKKIRAILLLLELAEETGFDGKRRIRFIKPVFKKSGVIREFLISLDGLNKYWLSTQSERIFRQQTKTEIKKNKKALLKAARDFQPEKLKKLAEKVKDICARTTISSLRANARIFIAVKIKHIQQLVLHGPATEDLHPIRIHIRHISTLAVLFREMGLSIMPQVRLKQIKQIQRLLGNWHDHEELTRAVAHFSARVQEYGQQREWEVLSEKLKTENEAQIDALKLALVSF